MDKLSLAKRSWNMSRIGSKNTAIELAVRKYLSHKSFKYRIHCKLPGKPDIVFINRKIAVFVHGCFWHGHGRCKEAHVPKTNSTFWKNKIENNKERDKKNRITLRRMGWECFNIFECQIENDIQRATSLLLKRLARRRIL